jgi:hypothetical protein
MGGAAAWVIAYGRAGIWIGAVDRIGAVLWLFATGPAAVRRERVRPVNGELATVVLVAVTISSAVALYIVLRDR